MRVSMGTHVAGETAAGRSGPGHDPAKHAVRASLPYGHPVPYRGHEIRRGYPLRVRYPISVSDLGDRACSSGG